MTLNEHREMLKKNQAGWVADYDRAQRNFVEHLWKWVKDKNPTAKKKDKLAIMNKMARLVFAAQGERPLFHFNDSWILAWNSPKDWGSHIRYEIGHMNPKNNGGESEPENLCFMSARDNQHIQSALPLEELLEAYFYRNENAASVVARVNRLKALHQSRDWLDLRSALLS
jgi:hypothetical protein